MQRLEAYFSGEVQGVGFRFTTNQIAEKFQVAGEVRNLPDGRVALVAEGLPDELDRFLAAVQQAHAGHITTTTCHQGPAAGTFRGFGVAY